MQPLDKQRYDYTTAGFDNFLNRSLDSTGQMALNEPMSTRSQAISFDRGGVSGAFPDSVQVGRIKIDGVSGRIDVSDESGSVVIRIGNLDD